MAGSLAFLFTEKDFKSLLKMLNKDRINRQICPGGKETFGTGLEHKAWSAPSPLSPSYQLSLARLGRPDPVLCRLLQLLETHMATEIVSGFVVYI